MSVALPELPDDRRAQPRRYGPADQHASPRQQNAVPPVGPRPPNGTPSGPNGAHAGSAAQVPLGSPQAAQRGPLPGVPWSGPVGPGMPDVGRPGMGPAHPVAPPRGRPEVPSNGRPVDDVAPRGTARPDPLDDEPTEMHGQVLGSGASPADPAATGDGTEGSAEMPGRHRRRAGASPDGRPASAYREQAEASGRKARTGRRRRPTFWKELPLLIVVALLLTFLIQTFLAKVYVIPSGSMETTLHGCSGCNNDRVLVDKVTYRFSDPQPGDVVVFRGPDSWSSEVTFEPPSNALVQVLQQFGGLIGLAPPDEKDFVKRVIAVGGQTIQCCDSRNRVLVDGQPLDEPYIYYESDAGPARTTGFGPVTIPDGELWMMGDSRNNSADSRVPGHGPIPVANVIGQARLIVLPFPRFGWIEAINPQTSAVALPSADTGLSPDAGAPLGLGLVGVLPLVMLRRRIDRRDGDIDGFRPGRPRR